MHPLCLFLSGFSSFAGVELLNFHCCSDCKIKIKKINFAAREPASFLYLKHNFIRGFLKIMTLPPSPSLLSLRTSCWSWNQIWSWESTPNCRWPAGMRVWEAKHNWSHTVPPSTQIPGLPFSSVSTNIGLKWPQNRDYCLVDASFMKVQRARFCHAAQIQGCHFKIMTGVTFGRLLCQSVFHFMLLQVPNKLHWSCSAYTNKCKAFQAHLSFPAFGWLMTDTDDPCSSANKIFSCFLQPLHLA